LTRGVAFGDQVFETDGVPRPCDRLRLPVLAHRHDDAPRLDPVRPDEAGGNVRIFVGKPSCRLCRAEHDGGAVGRVAQRACDHEITCVVGRSHSRQVRFAMRRPALDHIWHVVIEESEELVHWLVIIAATAGREARRRHASRRAVVISR
jgi:hypothetical protein